MIRASLSYHHGNETDCLLWIDNWLNNVIPQWGITRHPCSGAGSNKRYVIWGMKSHKSRYVFPIRKRQDDRNLPQRDPCCGNGQRRWELFECWPVLGPLVAKMDSKWTLWAPSFERQSVSLWRKKKKTAPVSLSGILKIRSSCYWLFQDQRTPFTSNKHDFSKEIPRA